MMAQRGEMRALTAGLKSSIQRPQVWTREPRQLNAARPQVPTYVDLFEIYLLTKQKSNCGKMRQLLRNRQNQAVFLIP